MKKVCAWCGKVLVEESRDGAVSHGICRECFEKCEQEMKDAYPGIDAEEFESGSRFHDALGDLLALLRNLSDVATVLGIVVALLLLAGSVLHFLTSGWVPDPIQRLVQRPVGRLK